MSENDFTNFVRGSVRRLYLPFAVRSQWSQSAVDAWYESDASFETRKNVVFRPDLPDERNLYRFLRARRVVMWRVGDSNTIHFRVDDAIGKDPRDTIVTVEHALLRDPFVTGVVDIVVDNSRASDGHEVRVVAATGMPATCDGLLRLYFANGVFHTDTFDCKPYSPFVDNLWSFAMTRERLLTSHVSDQHLAADRVSVVVPMFHLERDAATAEFQRCTNACMGAVSAHRHVADHPKRVAIATGDNRFLACSSANLKELISSLRTNNLVKCVNHKNAVFECKTIRGMVPLLREWLGDCIVGPTDMCIDRKRFANVVTRSVIIRAKLTAACITYEFVDDAFCRWRFNHGVILDASLALLSQLPPYVVLEVLDWLPGMERQSHVRKIRLIEAVRDSVRRIRRPLYEN